MVTDYVGQAAGSESCVRQHIAAGLREHQCAQFLAGNSDFRIANKLGELLGSHLDKDCFACATFARLGGGFGYFILVRHNWFGSSGGIAVGGISIVSGNAATRNGGLN